MEGLVKAVSDFLAAALRGLGFVGRPRRRAGIRDDLELLDRLRDSPDFGTESSAHRFLLEHITSEVAKLAGVESIRKRKIPWASVAMALLIAAPLAYWTYKLNHDGFLWLSLFPGTVAGLMLVAVLGMLFGEEEPS